MDKNLLHNLYVDDNRSIVGAKTYIPFFGRYAEISVSVATNRDLHHNESVTQVRFGFRPTNNKAGQIQNIGGRFFATKVDEFDVGGMIGARRDGLLIINDGDGGHKRAIEQTIEFPTISGSIVENSFFRGSGEDLPQFISTQLQTKLESALERCRQLISSDMGDSTKDRAFTRLDDNVKHTRKHINDFIQNVNWSMLFGWSDCGDVLRESIDSAIRDVTIRVNGMLDQDYDIPDFVPYSEPYFNQHIHDIFEARRLAELEAIQQLNAERQAAWHEENAKRQAEYAKANKTALSMMYDFLGDKFGKQFESQGYVELTQNGYTFTVAPSANIQVVDPKGNRAGLCIHTIGFSCNPIDEIVIAVLNIQNRFYEFMSKANYFSDRGFIKPKLKKAS